MLVFNVFAAVSLRLRFRLDSSDITGHLLLGMLAAVTLLQGLQSQGLSLHSAMTFSAFSVSPTTEKSLVKACLSCLMRSVHK